MDQYTKTAGSALFWGNRTKQAFLPDGVGQYTPRATTPATIVNYLFRYKKTDITIQPQDKQLARKLKPDGGFAVVSGVPFVYESVEVGTGGAGSGTHGFARINVASGLFQHLDKITIGNKSVTLVTDGSGNNLDKLNIAVSPLSTQTSQINSYLNQGAYAGTWMPDSAKLTYADGGSYIYCQHRFLNTNANGLAIGVVSSNPNISISLGIASPQKASVAIGNVLFKAFAAGSAGNNINVTYTTGAATSTPEISINNGNAIDIKIQNGVTTAQQIVNAVTSASSVNTVISAELIGATGSTPQAAPVSIRFLDGGTSHTVTAWQPGDKLKNCFIAAPKHMYAYTNINGNSTSVSEVNVPVNSTIQQTYHALHIIAHPSNNYGAWYRKNTARNATVRIQGQGSYNYVELEMKVAGTAGNTYSFEVRDNPGLGQFNQPYTLPKLTLENNGKRIVLTLGINGSNPSTHLAFNSFDSFVTAANEGDKSILDLVKLNVLTNSWDITTAMPEVFFSGGTAAGGSDLVRDGAADIVWGSCRKSIYLGFDAQGEIGIDGKSKIVDDSGLSLKSSGKFGGVLARVVPAGTAFKASAFIGDLRLTAVTGGTAGNSLSIRYTAGATAGSEVVSVSAGAITVQIEDAVSTAEQVRAALAAHSGASALAVARVIGTNSSPQSTAQSPSAISFSNGAAALSKDAGFFITHRRNIPYADTQTAHQSYCSYEVLFSKDLSDPNSFQHVCWFDQLNTSDLYHIGERVVFEIQDVKSQNATGQTFSIYNTNNSWNTPVAQKTVYHRNAHVTDNVVRYETLIAGSAGNKTVQIKQESGVSAGSETATLSGNLITIKIQPGSSTIAQIQAAIAANGAVAALIRAVPESGSSTSVAVSTTWNARLVMGGTDHWGYEGLWGFGYCNLNEFEFYPDNISMYNATTRKSPRGFPGEHMVEGFRLTRLT